MFGEVRKEELRQSLCRDKRPKFECHNWKIVTLDQPTGSKACCHSNTAPHPRLIVEQSKIGKEIGRENLDDWKTPTEKHYPLWNPFCPILEFLTDSSLFVYLLSTCQFPLHSTFSFLTAKYSINIPVLHSTN